MTIYCEDCKVKYWYGQTSASGRTIYNPEKLFDFLQEHQAHKIWTEDEYTDETFGGYGLTPRNHNPMPEDRYDYTELKE